MKTMLINVGGSSEPIIKSILEQNPSAIVFFCSPDSRKIVNEEINPTIFKELKKFINQEIVVCNDEQDIGDCTLILLSEVPKALRKLGSYAQWPEIVDYTGGTKTMSAAAVWASSKFPCQFNYVGAKDKLSRDKNGLGIVRSGEEKSVLLQNPWDKLAYFESISAIDLFNVGQYANSANVFRQIKEKTSEDKKSRRLFSILSEIVQGYAEWDSFNHQLAKTLIKKNLQALADVSENELSFPADIKAFSSKVKENLEFLDQITPSRISWFMIHDLLANALRRAELEKKFEDATARTYAVIEKIAKHELELKFGIDNSKAKIEQIPDELKKTFSEKYANQNGLLQFGAIASFKLLEKLDDIYGKRFAEREKIEDHLTERNYSILGHGIQSINEQKFTDLFNDALFLLKISENDLPEFPVFIKH